MSAIHFNLSTVQPPTGSARLGPGCDSVWFGLRMKAKRVWPGLSLALLVVMAMSGCASPKESSPQRAEAARALFDRTTREFHLRSAETHGAEQARLLTAAAQGYEQLLEQYPEQSHFSAQAARSLANVRACQNRVDDAVKLYASVARKYPEEDFEILMAWKSAADLLADAGRRTEAKSFYEKILARFDKPDAPVVVKTVVRGSRARLNGPVLQTASER